MAVHPVGDLAGVAYTSSSGSCVFHHQNFSFDCIVVRRKVSFMKISEQKVKEEPVAHGRLKYYEASHRDGHAAEH